MKKSVLITGSAGFIGFHLATKLLNEGYVVIGLDNLNNYYSPQLKKDRNNSLKKYPNYTFHEVSLQDIEALKYIFKNNYIDKVCHLAAQAGVRYSITNPLAYEESNLKGFLNILQCIRENNIKKLVYASSSSVYGNVKTPKEGYKEEDMKMKPISLYGATKIANEAMAYSYSQLYNFTSIGLRFFTVYGPWGRPDMAYFKFADAISTGKEITLFNHGNMLRDYTYIDDITDGIISALNIERLRSSMIFNLSGGRQYQLIDLVKLIEASLNKKAIIKYIDFQKGDMYETLGNCKKAQKILGFKPKTELKNGVKYFVDWYKKYFKTIL